MSFNTETTFNAKKAKRENARKKELVSRINRGPSLSEISVDIKLE